MVDGLNAIDKCYIYQLMYNVQLPGSKIFDSQILMHPCTHKNIVSLAKQSQKRESTNWYWKQQPLQQTIIVPTRTIIHPRLDFIIMGYVQDIPRKICSSNEAKKQYK